MKQQVPSTRPIPDNNSSSILIGILYLVGLVDWSGNHVKPSHNKRGRPFVYSPTIILRCFIVRIWFRLDSNRSLHHFLSCLDLPYNQSIMKACGLSVSYLPSRRTFDRRLKTIYTDIRERIATMGNLFVIEGLIKPYVVATDTALLKSNGRVWHKSSMKDGIIPCSGIDTDARWGYTHTKKWIFGYKLHMISSTDPISRAVPLSADVTTANESDKPVYPDTVSNLLPETLKKIHYMVADPGFNSKKLYDFSFKRGFELVCPVKKYKNTPVERLKLVEFYESALGQVIYPRRKISIEPLIEYIKSSFRIDPVPVKGFDKVRGIVLLSVLLYQILVYYNCKVLKRDNPRRGIKYMIGC
ncbi:MAG: transposase [Candidatus Nitrosocosmicus sp.]|nr:transposase [Candidatus Nitrosocosmicus sp.]